jgi:hypothetical protein
MTNFYHIKALSISVPEYPEHFEAEYAAVSSVQPVPHLATWREHLHPKASRL